MRESYPRITRGSIALSVCSAADLRQRAQSANSHAKQLVLLRLAGESRAEERLEWQSIAKWLAKIHLVFPEQAGAQPAVRGEPHAIAARAVGVR